MFLRRQTLLALPLAALLASLAGCGAGPLASPSDTNIESMTGIVHGGQTPIQGATVELYRTNPAATTYGAAGILIGTAVTDVNGNFTIASGTGSSGASANSTNCPAGTQAYITAAGGYTPGSSSSINNQMLEMVALGDCATVSSSTNVFIDELTTVAAAYALSGFMTTAIDGSNPFYTANVSAPVANNTSVSSITATAPAGLAHAFMNAAKLVNISNGTANSTASANTGGATTGTYGTTLGSVPVAEINVLGDIMQSCVNSVSGVNGAVLTIPVASGGSGYGATVAFSAALGTGASAKATVSPAGVVSGLSLISGGSGYSPAITFPTTTGTAATASADLAAGAVSQVVLETEGTLYGPTVTISGAGTGATASASISTTGVITGYVITNGGTGYTAGTTGTTATVTATNGTGTGAVPGAVTVSSGGAVTAIALGTAGTLYGVTATIGAPPAGGTQAALTTTITGGVITAVTVATAGTGYGPTVTINGAGSGATATATVQAGVLTALVLSAAGTGYAVPTVTVGAPNNSNGANATATATTMNGVVTAINVTSGGSGYTSAPTVLISGTATAGTATISSLASSASVAPSSTCSSLFADTPSITGKLPTNSLQAFINLARNPYPSAAATTGLLTLASSTPAFVPALAAAPADWSMSIVYGGAKATAVTGTVLNLPYWISLDMNDTIYLGLSAPTSSLPGLYGVSAYSVAVPAFASLTAGTATRGIEPDNLGNIWITNNSSVLTKYSLSTGLGTTYTTLGSGYDLAIDAANNIWVGHAIASGNNMDEWAYNSTTQTWASNYTAAFPGGLYGVSVDANQNIWAATYYISGASGITTYAAMLPNLGTAAAPSYVASGTAITPVTAQFTDSANHPYGIVFDASGNAWYDITGAATTPTSGLEEVVPNYSGSPLAVTSLTPGTFFTGQTAGANGQILGDGTVNLAAIDGAGTMFIPDNTNNTMHMYSTVTGNVLSPANGIASCLLIAATTTTCGATSSGAIYNPREEAVDSTGSLWSGQTSGGVTQTIGIAAPAYPQLSIGKPGLSPGLTAINPLP